MSRPPHPLIRHHTAKLAGEEHELRKLLIMVIYYLFTLLLFLLLPNYIHMFSSSNWRTNFHTRIQAAKS